MPDPTPASSASDLEKVRRTELIISFILRAGVLASLTLVIGGLVITLLRHPEYRSPGFTFHQLINNRGAFPTSVAKVLSFTAEGRGQGFVMLGLLLLIATPVLRVFASILVFLGERDWTYAVITTTVLLLLLLSFLFGKAEEPQGAKHPPPAPHAQPAPDS